MDEDGGFAGEDSPSAVEGRCILWKSGEGRSEMASEGMALVNGDEGACVALKSWLESRREARLT